MIKILTLSAALLLFGNIAKAQIQKEDFVIAQSVVSKTKRELVIQHLELDNSARHVSFWKLYNEYEDKRMAVIEKRYWLLKEYSEKYHTLDDATAASLSEGFLDNMAKIDALNKQYFKKFKKEVGGMKAATLFQIEFYVQTAVQANIQTQIPIIGELQKMNLQRNEAAGL
ncbi:MAG: hypothetical protein L0Y35_04145 [Flammeovirgaceae bacterium]|nr:hypothetical protein [Flammeovirgaceae bacterium]